MPLTLRYNKDGRAEFVSQMKNAIAFDSLFDSNTEVGKSVSTMIGGRKASWMDSVYEFLQTPPRSETDSAREKREEIAGDILSVLQSIRDADKFSGPSTNPEADEAAWTALMDKLNMQPSLIEKLMEYNDLTKNARINESVIQAAFGIADGMNKMKSLVEGKAMEEELESFRQNADAAETAYDSLNADMNSFLAECTENNIPAYHINDLISGVSKIVTDMDGEKAGFENRKRQTESRARDFGENSAEQQAMTRLGEKYGAAAGQLAENKQALTQIKGMRKLVELKQSRDAIQARYETAKNENITKMRSLNALWSDPENGMQAKMQDMLNKADKYKGRFHSDSQAYRDLKQAMSDYAATGGRDALARVQQTADAYLTAKEEGKGHGTIFSSNMRYYRLAFAKSVREFSRSGLEKIDKTAEKQPDVEAQNGRFRRMTSKPFDRVCMENQLNAEAMYEQFKQNVKETAEKNMDGLRNDAKGLEQQNVQAQKDYIKNMRNSQALQ